MTAPITAASTGSPAASASAMGKSGPGEDFTFDDLVSIVNPLQHIPIVSTIYRALTGETIKPLERIVGDTLYGGMPGFASGVANVVFEDVTGKDIGATALALLAGEDDTKNLASATKPAQTQTADASSPQPATSPASDTALVANGPPRPLMPQAAQTSSVVVAAATPAAAPVSVASASADAAASDGPTANGPPRSLQPQQVSDATGSAVLALLGEMNAQGLDADLSRRAFAAYQRSLSIAPGDSVSVH